MLCLYFVTTENSAKEDNEGVEQIKVFSTHSNLNKPEKWGKTIADISPEIHREQRKAGGNSYL